MATLRWIALGSLLAWGCGDPLVEGDYGGQPKLVLRGRFLDAQPALALPTDIGPSEWVRTTSGAQYGVGLPLFYRDGNGNRRRDPDESMVVHTPAVAVIFAPQALSAGDSPTGVAMPAGFHIVSKPLSCPPAPPPVADGDCGVPLGVACQADADCGAGGVCLANGPWLPTDGLCAIPEPPPAGCRPRGGALYRDSRIPHRAFWVQSCRTPADCPRGFPFQCDFTFGACLPTAYVVFQGEHALAPQPTCAASL